MSKLKYIVVVLVLAAFLPSCNNWLTVQPKDKIEKSKLFETEDGFWQAQNGLYRKMIEAFTFYQTNRWQQTMDYISGVWTPGGAQSLTKKLQLHMYRDGEVDDVLGNIFLDFYNIIAHANTILSYVDEVDFLSSDAYRLIKGEALAVRAFIHFELIRAWGPMPNNVEPGYAYLPYVREVSKSVFDYSSYDEYMGFLIEDLEEAESLLSTCDPILSYSNEELNVTSLVGGYDRLEYNYRQHRMNYYGVCALRARIALWMGDNETAITYARTVVDATNEDGSKKFVLGTADDVIKEESEDYNTNSLNTEHVFGTYRENFNWTPYFGENHMYLDENDLYDIYPREGDWRLEKWYVTSSNGLQYIPNKYRTKYDCWVPLIRLTEMYLILAECLPLQEANTMYQEFCDEKGVPYTTLTESNRMDVLLMEYYREFIGEAQIFFVNKRLGNRDVLWLDEDMTEGAYVISLPERETSF